MKAVILEDELLASNRLKRMLSEIAPDIKVLAVFETIQEINQFLAKREDVDLLFLDIHVADGNSFELFNITELSCHVIFTTAYDQYAIDAFRKNAIDYLLKPLKKDQLIEAIEKVTKSLNVDHYAESDFKSRIVINFMSKIHSVKTSDIAYIFSKNKISYFYLWNGDKLASDYKLQELEGVLNPKFFFRANRQFIIHIDAIDSIKKHQASRVIVQLNPRIDTELVISTDKTPLFKQWIAK